MIHDSYDENGIPTISSAKLYCRLIMDVIWPLFFLVTVKFFMNKEKALRIRLATMIIPILILIALILFKRNYFQISWFYNVSTINCFIALSFGF